MHIDDSFSNLLGVGGSTIRYNAGSLAKSEQDIIFPGSHTNFVEAALLKIMLEIWKNIVIFSPSVKNSTKRILTVLNQGYLIFPM